MTAQQTNQQLAQERTLLAAERTFSAWVRTGLAGLAGGLAIIRLIPFYTLSHQVIAHGIGLLLLLWGGAIFVYALRGYNTTCSLLSDTHCKKHKQRGIMLISAVLILVTALLFFISLAKAL